MEGDRSERLARVVRNNICERTIVTQRDCEKHKTVTNNIKVARKERSQERKLETYEIPFTRLPIKQNGHLDISIMKQTT